MSQASTWIAATDPNTKREYYVNTVTRQTTWQKPPELQTPAPAPAHAPAPEKSASPWIACTDPNSNRQYYVNTVTRATSWQPPTEGVSSQATPKAAATVAQPQAQVQPATEPAKPAGLTLQAVGKAVAEANKVQSAVGSSQAQTLAIKQAGGGGEWVEVMDKNTNRPYYVNPSTRETRWEKPVPPKTEGISRKTELPSVLGGPTISGNSGRGTALPSGGGNSGGVGGSGNWGKVKMAAHAATAANKINEAGQEVSALSRKLPNELITDIHNFKMEGFAAEHFNNHRKGKLGFGKKMTAEEMLRHTNEPIKKPLCKLPDGAPASCGSDACKIFSYLMVYMGDKSADKDKEKNPIKLIRHVLKKALKTRELRDEVYCQICRQTTTNPKLASTLRGWEMMAVCACTFPPSKDFENFLKGFLQGHTEDEDVGSVARFCLTQIQHTIRQGARHNIPTTLEIKSVKEQKPVRIKVHLLDGTFKTIMVESFTTADEVCDILGKKLKLAQSNHTSLFEYKYSVEEAKIEQRDRVLDVMGNWAFREKYDKDVKELLSEDLKKSKKKDEDDEDDETDSKLFRFVFKFKIIPRDMDQTDDPVVLRMLQCQAQYDVHQGNYPCSVEDSIKLAALQMQINFGNYDSAVHVPGVIASRVDQYIPQQWLKSRDGDQWEAEIMNVHNQLSGISTADAQSHYITYVRRRPVFGSSFFAVEQKGQFKELPQDLIAAINCDGLHLLKRGITKELLKTFTYSEVCSWAYSSNTFAFVTGDLIKQNKYTLETKRGGEMSYMCQAYVDLLLGSQ